MLNVTLFDVNKKLCEEWEKVFSPYKNVNIQNIELDKLDIHDILVTAGNSYGIMTGGIDYYVNKLCKFKAQSLVQQAIDRSTCYPFIRPFRLSSFPRPQRPQSCPLQRRLIAPRFGK